MRIAIGFSVTLLMIMACQALASGTHGSEDDAHSHSGTQQEDNGSVLVTQWTESMELFMQYPVLRAGQIGQFRINLTWLDEFKPVSDGLVTLSFKDSKGETHEFTMTKLAQTGLFTPSLKLSSPGSYDFELSYEGPAKSESFQIPDFVVHQTSGSIPAGAKANAAEGIAFLKEQQWMIPFATANTELREIKRSVWAIGEVLPSPRASAEIVAPVDGIVQVTANGSLALPGSFVESGDELVSIAPPAQVDGWTASRLAFKQAERNYERAMRLEERDAISKRELEQARTEFLAKKAGLDVLSGNGDLPVLTLRAPISGQIIEWKLRPGQRVAAGDKLMAIVDPKVVWLKVNVYENDFRTLGRPIGAHINTNGASGGWSIPEADMRVLTTGGALDPATRTIPVLIEVDNSSGNLSVNESSPVELFASDGKSATSVPRTAVYKDNGFDAVFVQIGGESFEKRRVVLGPHYDGWVSIVEGLSLGERVVTQGGYHVKLASTTAEIGHGHAH